jgi:outer membrane protein OmpA-like peptidoglycan-associated protein
MRLVFLVICLPLLALSQTDTLIYAEGKITNAQTKELVVAKISYQSLPYGSKVGFLHASSFSFPLYDNERYSISIEVPGFAPAKFILDPAEANADRKVIRDVTLDIPGSAADSVVHHAGSVRRLNILFEQNKYNILPASYSELDALALTLKRNPTMIIQLEGHTDPHGDPKKQLKLSKDRVESAKKYLIMKNISGSRIKTKAFGGTQPISTANTPEAHRLNRRVEMRVLQN